MKKIFTVLFISILVFAFTETTNAQMYEWTTPIGNNISDPLSQQNGSYGMFAENNAISYVTGTFSNTANFGNYDLTSYGGNDIFICKVGNNGNIIWAVKAGSSYSGATWSNEHLECGYGITGDYTGALYLTGQFNGTATFGTQTVTSSGRSDIFLAKYNAGGNIIWVRKAGGNDTARVEAGRDVAVDAAKNIYVIGDYYKSANFEGTVVNSGSGEERGIFIAKYNPDGNLIWVRTSTSTNGNNDNKGNGIVVSGNLVYITGSFRGSINFGSIQLQSNPSFVTDIFLVKMDAGNGDFLWGKQGGGVMEDKSNGIDCDAAGNIYITGSFEVYATFGAYSVESHAGIDAFVAKYNSNGTEQWAYPGGGPSNDVGGDIKVHNESNPANSWFYTVGKFFGPAIFGTIVLYSTYDGTDDTYGIKYDLNGNPFWGVNGGSTVCDRTYGAAITPNGTLLYTGNLFGVSTFGWQNFNQNNTWNMYVSKVRGDNGACISGTVYYDLTNNCQKDISDPPAPNRIVKAVGPSQTNYANTDANGLYKIYVPTTGTYTITVPNMPMYHTVCPVSYSVNVTSMGQYYTARNFGLYAPDNISDLVITATNDRAPRPGFCHNYFLTYSNVGTAIKSGTVTLEFPSLINYQSSIPAGTVSGNTITWNYSNLDPGQSANITVNFCVPVAVPLGTEICVIGTVNPIPGDQTSANNVISMCNTVVGSFDPNDKSVDHDFYVSPQEISDGNYLTYTIRFQNTGTAEAYTVFINDVLSDKLNPETLEILQTSHTMYYEISDDRNVTFYYDDIMLPDVNTNEPLSHGFVKFRVKPLNTLVLGEIIENFANIYFDFNPPVLTNTVTNKVGYDRRSTIGINEFMLTAPNVCKFKAYLKNTGTVPYEYADGQYVFEFNKDILNSGTGTLSILSSDLTATNQAPINPIVLTTTTPGQLQTDANPLPGAGNGKIIIAGDSILVAEFQLATDAPAFTIGSHINLAWKYSAPPMLNFSSTTAYSIYIGSIKAQIEEQGTYSINFIDNPLPVEIKSFTAGINKNAVKLQWTTEKEINNKGFEIERKEKDNKWVTAGFVQGHGTVNTPTKYVFEDRGLSSGEYRFRLKQIDYNGNYNYFNLESVIKVGIPTKFDLSQNYPNPFNPTTKIDFALPLDSKVSVILYDITGREVKRLLNNEQRSAGYYTIDFNGSSLSSGIYFYRFIAETPDKQTVLTKKLLFLK